MKTTNCTNNSLSLVEQEQINKELTGIISICSYCRKIRTNKHSWLDPDDFSFSLSGAQFSHGICPACIPRVLKEYGLIDSEPD